MYSAYKLNKQGDNIQTIYNIQPWRTPFPIWNQSVVPCLVLTVAFRGEWKSWLETQHSENYNHGICSHHFMAHRWGNSGNSDRLYFEGLKITADGDSSYEIKRHLLLGRKVMTNLDSILKNRHCFANKGPSSQSYGFSSIKKAECWRIDAFELRCWRRLLRVPWTARRSNQSILKPIGPEYSLKGLMLKLKLQYFGYLMWRTDSFE